MRIAWSREAPLEEGEPTGDTRGPDQSILPSPDDLSLSSTRHPGMESITRWVGVQYSPSLPFPSLPLSLESKLPLPLLLPRPLSISLLLGPDSTPRVACHSSPACALPSNVLAFVCVSTGEP